MKNSKGVFAIILTLTMLFSVFAVGDFAQAETNEAPFVLGAKKETDKTQQEKPKSYIEGEAVVLLEEEGLVSSGCSLSTALDVSGSIVVDDVENFSDKRNGFSVATVSSKKLSTKEILKDLQGKEGVLKAGPNFIYKASALTDDTYSDYQWTLENKGQNGGKKGNDIKPQKLWNEKATAKDAPVIAVVDTGVDYTHPDLKDKMWINPYPKKLKGTYGFDFTGENKDLEPMDNNGHGTHCAGIIAAQQDNKEGIAGISRDSKIMAVKYLDSEGQGTTQDAVAAYNYIYRAMKLGVNVVAINDSWGTDMYDEILEEIINTVGEKGAISVCAAGNDSVDMDTITPYSEYLNYWDDWDDYFSNGKDVHLSQYGMEKTFPACFDSNYIISVGATDEKGNLADYSNYGKKTVDLTAPGSNILSTVNYNCFIPNNYSDVQERTQMYKSKEFGIKTEFDMGKGSSTVTEVKNDYFSDSLGNDSSIKWEIKNAKEGDIYTFSIPYTAKKGEQNPYLSMMTRSAKVPDDDGDNFFLLIPQYAVFDLDGDTPVSLTTLNQAFAGDFLYYSSDSWSHIYEQMPENPSGNRKLVVAISCGLEGDYTLFFDNIGISNGTKNEEEYFGKYDYYTGTSMAAPAVTGAVALLKEKRSDLKAQEIVERIKCSIMQTKSLEDKCISGGSLDLSKIDEKVPVIEEYKTENNKPTVTGINLSGATVSVDGKTVIPESITDRKIVLKDTIRGNSTAKVETPEGYSVMTSYITSGTKYTRGYIELTGLNGDELATDGKNIYSLSAKTGELSYYPVINKSGEEYYLAIPELMDCDLDEYFKESINQSKHSYSGYSLTYYGGYLYYIVDLSLCSMYGGDEYASESVIVKMNIKNQKCSFIKYDFDNIKKPSIAVYNNSLYLIGGYDMEKGSLSTEVRKYSSSKWKTVSNLPTARALGKCQQVGTSLVYTMGTDGTENVPKNLV
ncbi:MAG: S8 family serine peptidase, partial [Oscillospiraceae bacterium]|nr:S8 family serine peptidase [Oscillospiraceae bacterium]